MKSKNNLIGRLLIAGVMAIATGAAWADEACSARTLAGMYVFSATGWTVSAATWVPKAIVEVIQFNADGTLTTPAATVANRTGDGTVVASPPNGTGQYAVAADCTGTLEFLHGPSFNIVVAPKGDDLWMIQTNPNNVFQGHATRVSR